MYMCTKTNLLSEITYFFQSVFIIQLFNVISYNLYNDFKQELNYKRLKIYSGCARSPITLWLF